MTHLQALKQASFGLPSKILKLGKHAHACLWELHTKAQLEPCPPWGAGALRTALGPHHIAGSSCMCPGKLLMCLRDLETLSASSAICCETEHKFAGVLEPSMVPQTLRAVHGSHLQGQSEALKLWMGIRNSGSWQACSCVHARAAHQVPA